jgi:hypothetical protein
MTAAKFGSTPYRCNELKFLLLFIGRLLPENTK